MQLGLGAVIIQQRVAGEKEIKRDFNACVALTKTVLSIEPTYGQCRARIVQSLVGEPRAWH